MMSHHFALEETDLQIREGGGRHPDPEIRGAGSRGGVKKMFQFGLKIRGRGRLPWIRHYFGVLLRCYSLF